ncbi:hypothetical protein A9G43_06745 [Gilliamella sp. Occ3-1]|jgi:hypothetical protein|uniref:hypothetical protein n=1 Tax=Gilliamella sp. Occ3-1 TaxID=3120253 RepID=UPI00080E2FE5|nr:hypothetical protein [Gilliamella apicola]OCG70841.1 hypothetical protein A9G43_06745 [Gilliamella apicola]
MENKDKSTQSDTENEMLFNSNGFELFIKILSGLGKFVWFIFKGILYVLLFFLETTPEKRREEEEERRNEISYYDDDEGHGYTRDGRIKW